MAMTISEIRQLSGKKLIEALRKSRRALAVKRFHVKTGQNQNIAELKKARKEIAQIQTVLNEKKD